MDVLIVGAGPTGLSAALELARCGRRPRIIEKRQAPSQLSRAVGILPKTMKRLAPSGVTTDILKVAIRVEEARVFDHQQEKLALKLKSRGEYGALFCLPQDRTEEILRHHLQALGIMVEYGCEFYSYKALDEQVMAEFGTQSGCFDYLIGADGVKSQVRHAAGIDYVGFDIHEKWSIADLYLEGWEYPQSATIWIEDENRLCLVIPLDEGRYRLVSNTPNALDALKRPIKIKRVFREGAFTISVRQAVRYQSGRVFLAGDAAHCHSPVGGRGMNLGIEDAMELAERIVNGSVDGYEASRLKACKQVMAFSERGRKLISQSPARLRNALFWIVSHLPEKPKARLALGILDQN